MDFLGGDGLGLWQNLEDFISPILREWGLNEHSSFVRLVIGFICLQFFLLFLFFFGALLSRMTRAISRRDDHARRLRFENILLRRPAQVFRTDFSLWARFFHLIRYQKGEVYFFRRFLVEKAELCQNREQLQSLFQLYHQLDFDQMDLGLLRSWMWWRRLSAIIRIEAFHPNEWAEILLPMIEDKHDLVAVAAIRTLSRMKFERKTERILETLSRRAPGRRDIFAEVMTHIGSEEIGSLLRFVEDCYDPYIASVAISVLGRLKAKEAIPLCMHLLQSADDLVVCESIHALAMMKATEALMAIRMLLVHESVEVRAAALRALRTLEDPQWKEWARRALEDASTDVQRVAFDLVGSEIRYV